MPTSLNLLDLFSNDPSGFGPTQTLDMTQPAFANTLAAYKTIHHQALIGILGDVANSSINKDELYLRMIFSYVTTILEAGLTPDPRNWTQMIDAIKAFAEKANIHDSTKTYKQGARVQNGFGGGWYKAMQDVPVNTLITNTTYWLPDSNFISLKQILFFTSNTTYTPSPGTRYIEVFVQGGGGGGSGTAATTPGNQCLGGGGGSGALAHVFSFNLTPRIILIGAGGVGGVGVAGGNGGTTSFGATSAAGGTGGTTSGVFSSSATNIAIGGTGGNSVTVSAGIDTQIASKNGELGGDGFLYGSSGQSLSGAGANSRFGSGGVRVGANLNGVNASNYGAGGSGSLSSQNSGGAKTGGNGSPGIVVLYEYI